MSDDVQVGRSHDEDGVAAVEFALVAIVFLTLVFGIIAFGVYFATQQAFSHAASEAALIAAELDPSGAADVASAEALVVDQLSFLGSRFDVSRDMTVGSGAPGCAECVTVELSYRWRGEGELFPVPFVPTPEWIRAKAVVRTW